MPKDDAARLTPEDQSAQEHAIMFAVPIAFKVGDRKIEVRELSVTELARVAPMLRPLFAAAEITDSWLAGTLSNVSCLVSSVALATAPVGILEKPDEMLAHEKWVGALNSKTFRVLAKSFIEQNHDFFGLCLELAGSVAKATTPIGAMTSAGAGPTPSSI